MDRAKPRAAAREGEPLARRAAWDGGDYLTTRITQNITAHGARPQAAQGAQRPEPVERAPLASAASVQGGGEAPASGVTIGPLRADRRDGCRADTPDGGLKKAEA